MITEKDVLDIASLARIHLEPEEARRLTGELEKILDYIGKLQKLDTSGVGPTSHVLPLKNVFREDRRRPSLDRKETLGNAPAEQNGSFKVPQVVE